MEYTAKNDAYSYVGAGDLKTDCRLMHSGRFELPLSHYHGITIGFIFTFFLIGLPQCQLW